MSRLLATLLLLLALFPAWADPLADHLEPRELAALQKVFPRIDLARVDMAWYMGEPGGIWAYGEIFLDIPTNRIFYDHYDFGFRIDLSDPAELEILCHELIHLSQSRRGFFWRLFMLADIYYLPYDHRLCEAEAYALQRVMARRYLEALESAP